MAKNKATTIAKNGPRAARRTIAAPETQTLTEQGRLRALAIRIQGQSGTSEGETMREKAARDRRDDDLRDLQASLEQAMALQIATSASDALAQVLLLSMFVDTLAAYASESEDKWRAERTQRQMDRVLYSLKRYLASVSLVSAAELGEDEIMPADFDPFQRLAKTLCSPARA